MQIPIVNGIYTDSNSEARTSYPFNLIPVPKSTGISNGYLRPAEGIVEFASLPGRDRGGINWNGVCYRVAGTQLISVDEFGSVTEIGYVGGSTQRVTFSYSFDRLAILSNGNLYYYIPTDPAPQLTKVDDPDLGIGLVDQVWIDGYFLIVDGEFIISSELNNPASFLPTKYGSSEVDPDRIVAIKKIRNEAYVLNRHTIEVFDNVGGTGFPFQRIDGAQITRGAVGTHACCEFIDRLAFLGGKLQEPVSIWVAISGNSEKIATREIDLLLQRYTEQQLSEAVLESRIDKAHSFLYVHLPNETLVYDAAASAALKEQVWHILGSSTQRNQGYRARNMIYCYNKWIAGDTKQNQLGYLTFDRADHYGEKTLWQFDVPFIYNEGRGGIIHRLELVSITGRAEQGTDSSISYQFSDDGQEYSMARYASGGKTGKRNHRIEWRRQGRFQNIRTMRFTGTSDSKNSYVRLQAEIEGLND